MKNNKKGDSASFDNNWRTTKEANYLHWTKDEPVNQIQLAFRNHWKLFQKIINFYQVENNNYRSLEVGCGRGSLSAYFSEAGWNTSLLDISKEVISKAKKAFDNNQLKGNFIVGDCLNLDFDNQFDLIFSIGLLEHFEDTYSVLKNQFDSLRPGGLFIGYVVPDYDNKNIQNNYVWINEILKNYIETSSINKSDIYRSDFWSDHYIRDMEKIGFEKIKTCGVYPLPMISNSPSFPFTLLDKKSESILVNVFNEMLEKNNPYMFDSNWTCEEGFGQAFILTGIK